MTSIIKTCHWYQLLKYKRFQSILWEGSKVNVEPSIVILYQRELKNVHSTFS